MWKTTNYKGETVTWYSEEEYTILEQENQEAREIIAELEHKNKELKKENEELKQERLEVARLFDKTCRCDDLQEDTAKCQYFNDDCISIRHCMKKFRSLKDSYKLTLEEIRDTLMCKIYGLNENASQLDYMCYVLDKFEKIRIKILTKINEVLK